MSYGNDDSRIAAAFRGPGVLLAKLKSAFGGAVIANDGFDFAAASRTSRTAVATTLLPAPGRARIRWRRQRASAQSINRRFILARLPERFHRPRLRCRV